MSTICIYPKCSTFRDGLKSPDHSGIAHEDRETLEKPHPAFSHCGPAGVLD
jgi:hypothetical protein